MPTVVVTYHQSVQTAPNIPAARHLLGSETFTDIAEGLVPKCAQHSVFLVKRFAGVTHGRWFVRSCVATSVAGAQRVTYEVDLTQVISPYPEEYLDASLSRMRTAAAKVLHPGALVEVDFGFVQASARSTGTLGSNDYYADTLQHGEMNKRRLAIVNKVYDNRVQVIPVSSQGPASPHDKTTVQLSDPSVAQLAFYGANGKPSWAICLMVQTVALTRILPPLSWFYPGKNQPRKKRRSPSYGIALTTGDFRQVRRALAHAVGFKEYDDLVADSQMLPGVQQQLAQATQVVIERDQEIARLWRIERVARAWAREMGGEHVLDQQVAALLHP